MYQSGRAATIAHDKVWVCAAKILNFPHATKTHKEEPNIPCAYSFGSLL